MPKHQFIVMDHTGDTRTDFDPEAAQEVTAAMERFNELVKGQGFTAGKRVEGGKTEHLREFDRTAKETIFFPRLKGG